jgi:hypothetical protein
VYGPFNPKRRFYHESPVAQRTIDGLLVLKTKKTSADRILVKLRPPGKGIDPAWIEMDFRVYQQKIQLGFPSGRVPPTEEKTDDQDLRDGSKDA